EVDGGIGVRGEARQEQQRPADVGEEQEVEGRRGDPPADRGSGWWSGSAHGSGADLSFHFWPSFTNVHSLVPTSFSLEALFILTLPEALVPFTSGLPSTTYVSAMYFLWSADETFDPAAKYGVMLEALPVSANSVSSVASCFLSSPTPSFAPPSDPHPAS